MAHWPDRIQELRYTAPSGASFTFGFENVEKETDLKTAAFTFIDKPGAYIQNFGRAGRRYPLSCIFAGPDCMDSADAFELALEELGYGELQHPAYGTHRVVPTGTIKRSDNLVTESNQSVVEVTFSETISESEVADSVLAGQDTVETAYGAYQESAVAAFTGGLYADNASETIKLSATMSAQAQIAGTSLQSLAQQDPDAWASFVATIQGLEASIDAGLNGAMDAARQVLNLMHGPARLFAAVQAKINGYRAIIDQVLTKFAIDPIGLNNICNQFAVSRLTSFSALAALSSGIATSPLPNSGFKSRAQAVTTADTILTLLDSIQGYQDTKITSNAFTDTGEAYEQLLAVVYSSVRLIIQNSFALPTQRYVRLPRDRQVIELVVELYGNLDRLDDFIFENNLCADEIMIIPMNREIMYYV